jgi:hypothetical protein
MTNEHMMFLVNMTLEKNPMGKTSKREMYIYGSQANATNKEKNNGT